MFENKSGSAILAIAGISLMGPVGALAGLAAKKKGEIVFELEFKKNAEDEMLRGKTLIGSCPANLFELLKRDSRALSKVTTNQVDRVLPQPLTSELNNLKALRDSGAITEEEFVAAKAKLLDL